MLTSTQPQTLNLQIFLEVSLYFTPNIHLLASFCFCFCFCFSSTVKLYPKPNQFSLHPFGLKPPFSSLRLLWKFLIICSFPVFLNRPIFLKGKAHLVIPLLIPCSEWLLISLSRQATSLHSLQGYTWFYPSYSFALICYHPYFFSVLSSHSDLFAIL